MNAFYNANLYKEDNREPSYRKVVVAGPQIGEALVALRERAPSRGQAADSDRLAHLQILNLLVQVLIERWSDQAIELENQLAEKDRIIEQLSRDLDDRYLLLRTIWRKARRLSRGEPAAAT